MATDLETGETGSAAKLFVKALERRQKRWHDKVQVGLNTLKMWKDMNPNRKVSPTRFYKLVYDY